MSQTHLAQVFSKIPVFKDVALGDFLIEPLPGYTNENYRLYNQYQDWVLRIPRSATERFIDRDAEAYNQSLAHQSGLAPQVSWRDEQGVTLTPTLRANRMIHAGDFANDEMLQAIVEPIRRLHRSGLKFHGRVNLGALLTDHFALLSASEQKHLAPRLSQARRVLAVLESRDEIYVASHNDLVLENLLFTKTGLWLIDWEYSSMASPYWDLATLCNAANLDLSQSRKLLRIYCAGSVLMEESVLFDYRGLLKLLSDCWMAALVDSH